MTHERDATCAGGSWCVGEKVDVANGVQTYCACGSTFDGGHRPNCPEYARQACQCACGCAESNEPAVHVELCGHCWQAWFCSPDARFDLHAPPLSAGDYRAAKARLAVLDAARALGSAIGRMTFCVDSGPETVEYRVATPYQQHLLAAVYALHEAEKESH